MKFLAVLFTSFSFLFSYSQPVINGNTLLIKPSFNIGETKTYLVKEEIRSDDLVGAAKAENEFRVSFTVLDTTKGNTIVYTVQTIQTANKKANLFSVVAKISNNIQLVYRIAPSGWVTQLLNFEDVRQQLLRSLDSLAQAERFNERDEILNDYLRETLKKPEGPEICLAPLMIFNNAFNQQVFRAHKDYAVAMRYNILNKPLIPGVEITQLKTIEQNNNIGKVSMDFHGDRDSAAKYNAPLFQQIYASISGKTLNKANLPSEMRNDFEREYQIILSSGWPKNIYDKSIEFYMQKITRKTSIQMVGK